MKYLVHINPIPGTDSPRVIEVEATDFITIKGSIIFMREGMSKLAAFAPNVWIYVEPAK